MSKQISIKATYPYNPGFVKFYKIAVLFPLANILFFVGLLMTFFPASWFLLKWTFLFYCCLDAFLLIKNDMRYYSIIASINVAALGMVAIIFAFLYIHKSLQNEHIYFFFMFVLGYSMLFFRQFFIPDFKKIKDKFIKTQLYLQDGIIWRKRESGPFIWYRGNHTQKIIQIIWELVGLGFCMISLYFAYRAHIFTDPHDARDNFGITISGLVIGLLFTQFFSILIYTNYLTWKATWHVKKRFVWGTTE